MKYILTYLFIFIGSITSFGQILENKYQSQDDIEWINLMYQKNPEVDKVIQAYTEYYKTHEFVKNEHTQYYKRLIMSLRSVERTEAYEKNVAEYLKRTEEKKLKSDPSSSWSGLGPFDFDIDAASRSYAPGAAHVYTVEQSSSNSNLIYAGTANAGVWKSTDNGANWTITTREMMIGSVLSLEIDHSNEDIVYFAGAGKLYKTTNGAIDWDEIGDAGFNSINHSIRDLVLDPDDSDILFVASNNGFYRSTDGGDNFSLIESGVIQEIEIHPTDHDTIYMVKQTGEKTEFYRSTDNALNFTLYINGWPDPGVGEEQKRTEIAVSADEPDHVFALATGAANGGSGLYGVYVSTDLGENWTFQCCGPHPAGIPDPVTNPNLMGWQDDGSDDGGQYYYDLAFEVSNTNADSMFVAGVNLWVSDDGGVSFVCPAKWSHPHKPNYVHADIHDVGYFGNELWIACDGGIFYSTDNGANIDKRMNGIEGTDFWGFGAGWDDGNVMLGGTYHNGTLLKDNDVYINGWICTQGGDNIRGFVNYGDNRKVVHDGGGKVLSGDRTQSIGSYSFSKMPNAHYITGMTNRLEYDPRSYNIVYSGVEGNLWRSEDGGGSFELIHSFGGERITSVKMGWDNPDVLYVVHFPDWWGAKKLYKSEDAGQTWTDITPSNFTSHLWAPFDIAVDPENSDNIWLVRTPQSRNYNNLNGEKVYKSTDGGTTWTNLTTATLDGEYITNIEHQYGTDGGIYIGTARSVYYRNNTMSDWEVFNTDLPALCFSTKLVPYYKGGKLRNATTRSVYEVDFYETSQPIAQISADKLESFCTRDTVYFRDHSVVTDNGTSWSWTFEGGSPSSSTEEHPKVVYSTPGTYDVSLTVTDANGSDSQTITDFITVTPECEIDTIPGYALDMAGNPNHARIPTLDLGTTNELTMSAWVKPNGIQNDYTGIITGNDGTSTFGFNFRQNNEIGYHWPNGQWFWSSGLTAPANEWSHVAVVVESDKITVYLNGKSAVHNITPDAVNLDVTSMYMGSYLGWGGRNFNGLMDEVCIWSEAKTTEEIRDLIHLTKTEDEDPSLLVYYQFNRTEGIITDRIGIRHATLVGAPTRSSSTAPIGAGTSDRLNVSSGGNYVFPTTDVTLEFPGSGTFPNGDLVISRINQEPDQNPTSDPVSRSYWVINNYGTNETFTELVRAKFDKIGFVSEASEDKPNSFILYKRESTDDGDTWSEQDYGDLAVPGADGSVSFIDGNGITSFSQFVISNTDNIVPVEWMSFNVNINADKDVELNWRTGQEFNSDKFIVERSFNGIDFDEIGSVPSKGNSYEEQAYQFIDTNPKSGLNYYRIKQMDLDGSFDYSETKSVLLESLPFEILVYPNPLSGDKILNIKTNVYDQYLIQIYDSAGKLLLEKNFDDSGSIDLTNFSKGSYFYQFITANFRKHGSFIIVD